MLAWRIAKAKRANDLSGTGAALEGGRWNEIDLPAVYMGLSPAICCLETFVHTSSYPSLPLVITEFLLPDDQGLYLEPDPNQLPKGWNGVPADKPSMDYGSAWLRSKKHLGLIVPSAVMPLERNIVINPAHQAIERVVATQTYTFMYDERMFIRRR